MQNVTSMTPFIICFTAGCVNLNGAEKVTLEKVCKRLDDESQVITLFAENYTPINCRSSLEGVFHFAYQVCSSDINLRMSLENHYLTIETALYSGLMVSIAQL